MAKVDMTWMTGGIHGTADKTSNFYLRQDRKTGRVYAVRCPKRVKKSLEELSDAERNSRNRFELTSRCSTAFVREGRAAVERGENSPLANAYLKVAAAYNDQSESPFMRGYVMKHYTQMTESGKACVVVDDFTFFDE